jgi:hypothetical protein
VSAPKYLKNVSGVITEQAASESSASEVIVATNSSGQIDISFMPSGIGPDTASVLASEALSAGNLVNIYNNAGTANCRKADGSTTGKIAHGFVLASVSSGGTATVYLSGLNTSVTGLTPGQAFLSDSTPGASTATAPTTAGHTVQKVGIAVSATALQFDPGEPITLA